MGSHGARWIAAGIGAVTVIVLAMPGGAAETTAGIDVSHHQGAVDWGKVRDDGIGFAFVKATEGTTYRDPDFAANYTGAHKAGLVRGAYHFALPDRSPAAAQADHLVSVTGGWQNDGRTLPGALDIEYNPYGPACYGLTQPAMTAWIKAFLDRYRARTGRHAVIYSTADWWARCTGNHAGLGEHPLWIARYADERGDLPAGWPDHTFWQYTDRGKVSGIAGNVDRNRFNGTRDQLQALASSAS